MTKNFLLQIRILGFLTLVNFIVQIPYFIHLYYSPSHPFPNLRAIILMGSVFVLFLTGYCMLEMHKKIGYWLLILFLTTEFLFYVYSAIFSVIRGFGLFFQLANPDQLLRMVFLLGYINLFASGYFLFLLVYKRNVFLRI